MIWMIYDSMVCRIVFAGDFSDVEMEILIREMGRSLYFFFAHSAACTTHVYANTPHPISKSGFHAQTPQP